MKLADLSHIQYDGGEELSPSFMLVADVIIMATHQYALEVLLGDVRQSSSSTGGADT